MMFVLTYNDSSLNDTFKFGKKIKSIRVKRKPIFDFKKFYFQNFNIRQQQNICLSFFGLKYAISHFVSS